MPAFILYLLKSSISLSVVWVFYRLILRNLTFYTLNRWVLVGYSLLSFIIPLVRISPLQTSDTYSIPMNLIPSLAQYKLIVVPPPSPGINWWLLLELILCLGAAILLIRTVIRWLSLRTIREKATLISDTEIKIYQVDQQIIPFSFGSAIYINPSLHSESEWEEIILHEYVHIRQRHTLDILLAELLTVLNWYNPFVWLIRYSIRQNLEFIADQKVLETGFDKKEYQYHLLKVVGQSGYRLANNFNFSSLKKRIVMMNKLKSARLHLLRFLLILPVLAILLLAFRDRYLPAAHSDEKRIPALTRTDLLPADPVSAELKPTAIREKLAAIRLQPAAFPADTLSPARRDTAPLMNFRNPLFIVDGQEKPSWTRDSIRPEDIASMNILKGDEAYRIFGERGANGVIAILTTAYQNKIRISGPEVVLRRLPAGNPIYIVDGVEIPNLELSMINPKDINSIVVIKDAAGKAYYGERGRNGVINISLKKEDRPQVIMDVRSKDGTFSLRADSITIRDTLNRRDTIRVHLAPPPPKN